ncbi:MAG: Sensor histidine kinase [uncultured Segetibacter sp.]|uniref:Sensor histidine kinase n=1 Tax=uncultured Segetibacter sp. TaxID=481133 RepID=A0A6J4RS50_9BACT|nr:MAG: Sensor histidine kinase [uncultured Segetibacter sp.]
MRHWLLIVLLSLVILPIRAQIPPPITFNGQPALHQGLSVEPYALFYENPSADTTQPFLEVVKQKFIPASQVSDFKVSNNRQMKQTSQVTWLQFQIKNTHPTDTLHLWYGGGPHAVFSLYVKEKTTLHYLARGGMCTVPVNQPLGPFALPLVVPPHTTNHYFLRVADYLLLFANTAGAVHTTQSYQSQRVAENTNIRWLFFAMSMIIGCLLLMSLYSFYQYYLSRDKAFLYYAIYAALAFCWMLEFANPRFELGLTPAFMPWLAHPWAFSFSHILSLVYALFLARLLSIPQQQPRLWRFIRPLMIVLALLQLMVVVQLFTGILIKSAVLFYVIDALPAFFMGVLMIIATLRSRSKLKPYLLVGEVCLYVISLSPFHGVFLLENVSPQVYAFINYPPFFMAAGLFVELFCFSLALAYRNKLVEVEKNSLQQHYTVTLESELAARTNEIKEQSRRLEAQHAGQLQLAFEQKLAEMEMTALRAQMNPHFIFNCLNSIKLYTTDNDAAKASAYLTKFSRLIRLVLENSRSERVTLKNELEALELYLEMEAMRFKNKLRFAIDVTSELDADLIEIPPMLLQPYVENAIWHGLMHKKEGGCVHINVAQPETNLLLITITDDGIGRTKAAALKSKSATATKSFGMKVTNERIALINQLYQTNTKVQVHDLTDAEGNAAGTEVVLEILI